MIPYNFPGDYDPVAVECWLQQPEETDWQYEAFQSFRNAGPNRNWKVAREIVDRLEIESAEDPFTGLIFLDHVSFDDNGNSLPPPRHPHISDQIEEWAKKYAWLSRCAAWDREVQKQYQARMFGHAEKWDKLEQDVLRGYEALSRRLLGTAAMVVKCPERIGEISELPMQQKIAMVLKMGRLIPAKLKADAAIRAARAKKAERVRASKRTKTFLTVCTYQPKRAKEIDIDALLKLAEGDLSCGIAEDVPWQPKDDEEYAEGEYDGIPRDDGSLLGNVQRRKDRKSEAASVPADHAERPSPPDEVREELKSATSSDGGHGLFTPSDLMGIAEGLRDCKAGPDTGDVDPLHHNDEPDG